MSTRSYLLLLCIPLLPCLAYAQGVEQAQLGQAVERNLPTDTPFMQWAHDPKSLQTQTGDKLQTRQVPTQEVETVKLTNVVPPIHFASGKADIPTSTIDKLRKVLQGLRERKNVRLHLIGHADNQPLSPALAKVYKDNEGLSRARAGEVAEYFQTALNLSAESISYDWAGATEPIASNATAAGRALNRRVEVEVWYDKVKTGSTLEDFVVRSAVKQIKVCRMETVCKLRYKEGRERRARLKNVVPPLHYDDDVKVPPRFIEQVRQALRNLADRQHVVVKFIGFTDNVPLAGRMKRIYGTSVALSKARARRVALAVQDALHLPSAEVDSDGHGDARPIASNDTAQGRALNRRIEVEFWYDDPLQELPDEPQLCPSATGSETETKIYHPPWGKIKPLQLDKGQPVIPPGYLDILHRALADVADKTNARLRFIGYTANKRLERRTALIYRDDVGLSRARARKAMQIISKKLHLAPSQAEYEGRGFVQSHDVVNSGFIQGKTSYVTVQVVYDQLAVLDDYEGVDIKRITKEIKPQNPLALNTMRITVDGKPIDDPGRSSEDIQRCTDVAMDDAHIQFGFDDLQARPRLSVAAEPNTVAFHGADGEDASGTAVRFRMYSNYSHFIDHAEIRIFGNAQSLRGKPMDVVPVDKDGLAEWQPKPESFSAPVRELKYVLRAYGKDKRFDETTPQPLWMIYGSGKKPGADRKLAADPPRSARDAPDSTGTAGANSASGSAENGKDKHLLAAYGNSELARQDIPLSSAAVRVSGSGIPARHSVWVAGRRVPVDAKGNFVAEEILPNGTHTVEVAVLDQFGNGKLYLRDLQFRRSDWFHVGMADLTLAQNHDSGPVDQLTGANAPVNYDASSYGRFAFYVNGKFGEDWRLAASADTREEPISDLFSDFMKKSPDSLFRRINPDYYYPTFGDDGTVQEMAPTLGKFFVKLQHDQNRWLWGNFKVDYTDNELAQVDRGLYGANLHYQSSSTTSFGDQRFAVDAFTAEPGTVAAREEFRGTGGSLYFLRRQDILTGSERVRIEVRDKASGIVTAVENLRPGLDYDIDYLQGRIMLAEPLASTVSDKLLIRSGGLEGNEAYLVVRYEYTPGFQDISTLATGAQVHYWVNDHVKLGLTANTDDQGDSNSNLGAADVTFRVSTNSWLKLQAGNSRGLVSSTSLSKDGGFSFSGYDPASFTNADAGAYRGDLSLGFKDFMKRGKGRLTLYKQNVDAGYSAPGLGTLTDTSTYGGAFAMPVTSAVSLRAKEDRRVQKQGLKTNAQELDVDYRLNKQWRMRAGVRKDARKDDSTVVPLTQEQGERTDAVVQLGYDSRAKWSAYGFVQDTVSATGNRPQNGRVGTGGSYRISDRLRINAEVSNGDLGPGGKIGTTYLPSARTTLYLNYSLENGQADDGFGTRNGSVGNLVSGVKTRLSDSASVYAEERYQSYNSSTGLTHTAGVTLSPTERLKLSANTDIGTLTDAQTGAQTKRRAEGVRVGYGFDSVQFASGIEYRYDETQQPNATTTKRTTWLFRNDFKYQITPDWRLLGKLNHSFSNSSQGQFYDGGFTEAVLGYAYRPVRNDRLDTLIKYTYFYNVPATDQITLQGTPAEFIQKSRIAAVDVTYRLTPRWSIGGKYAYRRGEMSLDRQNPQFFDNTAQLYILRGDWRFAKKWEGLAEARLLDMPALDNRRSGALLVVSRYLTKRIKLGVGYNFTDFSDDLTDLSFNHQGAFINLTGAM